MRILNLKVIGMVLFVFVFLVGTFFINTLRVDAEGNVGSYTTTYTVSSPVSSPNTDGGVTTIIRVGCAPTSGDKYDINTGKLCSYPPIVSIRVGCAVGSPDLYDINTGKACTNKTAPVIVGCAAGSGHLYDITTGKLCTNYTTSVVACRAGSGHLFDITTGKPCPVIPKVITTTPTPKPVVPPVITTTPVKDVAVTNDVVQEGPGEAKATGNSELEEDELTVAPIEEVTDDGAKEGGNRIKTIFTWPPTVQAILLFIIIVLALAYGIYRFFTREDDVLEFTPRGDKSRNNPVKPIVQPQAPTSSMPVQKPQEPVNRAPENKIPNTPLSQPQNTNPTQQMPLNIPGSQGNPNPQGQPPVKS